MTCTECRYMRCMFRSRLFLSTLNVILSSITTDADRRSSPRYSPRHHTAPAHVHLTVQNAENLLWLKPFFAPSGVRLQRASACPIAGFRVLLPPVGLK